MTKFSTTCSSSVKLACTFRIDDVSTSSVMDDMSRSRFRSWSTSLMTSRRSTSAGGPVCWALKRDRLRMISRARPLCVLTKAISSRTTGSRSWPAFEQLDRSQDRLQRVVELVRDAGHEHAHGRETLLADDLPLKRLHRLAHLALLFELLLVRGARLARAAPPSPRTIPAAARFRGCARAPVQAARSRLPRSAARRPRSRFRSSAVCQEIHSASARMQTSVRTMVMRFLRQSGASRASTS